MNKADLTMHKLADEHDWSDFGGEQVGDSMEYHKSCSICGEKKKADFYEGLDFTTDTAITASGTTLTANTLNEAFQTYWHYDKT